MGLKKVSSIRIETETQEKFLDCRCTVYRENPEALPLLMLQMRGELLYILPELYDVCVHSSIFELSPFFYTL